MYLKMASDSNSSDGVLKVWVDGVLNVRRTDVCTLGSDTNRMVIPSGMWGGNGDTKAETDYLWYRSHICERPLTPVEFIGRRLPCRRFSARKSPSRTFSSGTSHAPKRGTREYEKP